jgi:hypothetical protein
MAGLGGCSDGDPATAGAADAAPTTEDRPTEYVYDGGDAPAATFDADAIERALDDAITGVTRVKAAPVLDAYAVAVEQMEPGCPDWYEVDGNVFWYADCTTEAGTSFDGYGFTTLYEDADAFGDGSSWDLTAISGAATIRDPDGYAFHLGGNIYDGTGTNPDGARLWVSQVAGGFVWEAPQAAGTWLAQPSAPSMLLYAVQYDLGGPQNYLYLTGSVEGLSAATSAVRFDEVAIGSTALGLACSAEPMGTVSVRDARGAWWDVRFDIDEGGRLTGECDGCGGVFTGETYHGEVCADFSSMLDWEETPW